MSMTLIAFLRKTVLPSNEQIQDAIQSLGYDFEILAEAGNQIDQNGLECRINGNSTYFETYVENADEVISECNADWIRPDLTDQDTAISFVWGADYAAGLCIGLISIALIDRCGALIYYLDDEMRYSREMLVEDSVQFLGELSKQGGRNSNQSISTQSNRENTKTKLSLWQRLKNLFKRSR